MSQKAEGRSKKKSLTESAPRQFAESLDIFDAFPTVGRVFCCYVFLMFFLGKTVEQFLFPISLVLFSAVETATKTECMNFEQGSINNSCFISALFFLENGCCSERLSHTIPWDWSMYLQEWLKITVKYRGLGLRQVVLGPMGCCVWNSGAPKMSLKRFRGLW